MLTHSEECYTQVPAAIYTQTATTLFPIYRGCGTNTSLGWDHVQGLGVALSSVHAGGGCSNGPGPLKGTGDAEREGRRRGKRREGCKTLLREERSKRWAAEVFADYDRYLTS